MIYLKEQQQEAVENMSSHHQISTEYSCLERSEFDNTFIAEAPFTTYSCLNNKGPG